MDFYAYIWVREDGSPYYVGKGTGNRAFKSDGHGVHCPPDRSRIMVFPMLNEAEAFEAEVSWIDLFGRKDLGTGCLRNLTNGGEGTSGWQPSAETKAKQSASQKGKPRPWLIGHKLSAKSIEKLRTYPRKKGVHNSPATEIKPGQHISPATQFGADGWVPWNKGMPSTRRRDPQTGRFLGDG